MAEAQGHQPRLQGDAGPEARVGNRATGDEGGNASSGGPSKHGHQAQRGLPHFAMRAHEEQHSMHATQPLDFFEPQPPIGVRSHDYNSAADRLGGPRRCRPCPTALRLPHL